MKRGRLDAQLRRDIRVASGFGRARHNFLSDPESTRVIGRLRTYDIAPCKCARPPNGGRKIKHRDIGGARAQGFENNAPVTTKKKKVLCFKEL